MIEISLLGLKTSAIETANELISFLSANPSEDKVLDYHTSETAQQRLKNF
ncbi:MAG: hypothetical protein R2880_15500 [Deinococcales bacterium]